MRVCPVLHVCVACFILTVKPLSPVVKLMSFRNWVRRCVAAALMAATWRVPCLTAVEQTFLCRWEEGESHPAQRWAERWPSWCGVLVDGGGSPRPPAHLGGHTCVPAFPLRCGLGAGSLPPPQAVPCLHAPPSLPSCRDSQGWLPSPCGHHPPDCRLAVSPLPSSCLAPPVLAAPALPLPLPFLVSVTVTTLPPAAASVGCRAEAGGLPTCGLGTLLPCVFSEFLALQRPQLATPAGLPRLAYRVRACMLRHFGHV